MNDSELIDKLCHEYYDKNKTPEELEYLLSRSMIRNIFQFVGLCDINGILLQANDSALKAAGLSKSDVIGKPFWESYWWVIDQETSDRVKQAVEKAKQGDVVRYDVKINAPNKSAGGFIYIDFIISPIKNSQGEVVFLIPEAIDINEKKIMEQDLIRAKDEAEKASRDKSLFLATMTHDLRTPLNGIKCLTDLLEVDETDRSKLAKLGLIQRSVQHLSDIITKILNFSAFEGDKIVSSENNLSFQAYFEDLVNIYRTNARSKGLELFISYPNIHVKIDKFLLNQIMINLVGNAIKFTEKGYINIRVTAERNDFDEYDIQIEVKDTGVGISEDEINLIFDDFYRSVDKRNSNIVGTGLGLNICKKAVNLLGGTLNVTSQLDSGTQFTVKFKASVGQQTDIKVQLDNEFDPKQGKNEPMAILIADDNFINRFALSEFLRKFGYHDIEEAENGEEMIDMYRNRHYDVIYTDIRMPKMSGVEASRIILNDDREESKPIIIAVTANSLSQDIQYYRDNGIKSHISKPIDIAELKASLKNAYVLINSRLNTDSDKDRSVD